MIHSVSCLTTAVLSPSGSLIEMVFRCQLLLEFLQTKQILHSAAFKLGLIRCKECIFFRLRANTLFSSLFMPSCSLNLLKFFLHYIHWMLKIYFLLILPPCMTTFAHCHIKKWIWFWGRKSSHFVLMWHFIQPWKKTVEFLTVDHDFPEVVKPPNENKHNWGRDLAVSVVATMHPFVLQLKVTRRKLHNWPIMPLKRRWDCWNIIDFEADAFAKTKPYNLVRSWKFIIQVQTSEHLFPLFQTAQCETEIIGFNIPLPDPLSTFKQPSWILVFMNNTLVGGPAFSCLDFALFSPHDCCCAAELLLWNFGAAICD